MRGCAAPCCGRGRARSRAPWRNCGWVDAGRACAVRQGRDVAPGRAARRGRVVLVVVVVVVVLIVILLVVVIVVVVVVVPALSRLAGFRLCLRLRRRLLLRGGGRLLVVILLLLLAVAGRQHACARGRSRRRVSQQPRRALCVTRQARKRAQAARACTSASLS